MGFRRKLLALGAAGGVLAAASLVPGPHVQASSHREAPLISQDPLADNTDLYLFRDPGDPSMVVIMANYIGLEQPAAGPNFVRFADDVLYDIHIDNNGDVADDARYQFRFRTTIGNPATFLYNTGQVTSGADADLNVRQVYSVRRTDGAGSTMLATDLPTPPANIGPRSTPNYETALAAPAVASLPGGGQVFAGTRDDPFFVDLGSVFDLLGLRPLNAAHFVALAAEAGRDGLAGKSVHTIALRLPLTSVLKAGAPAGCTGGTTLDNKDCVIGVYASASRQRVQVLTPAGGVPRVAGRWVQVSRLGIPLVNEVLIPLGQKDRWNASDPADDVANFGSFILNPEPAALIPVLYPGVSTPSGPRTADVLPVLQGAGAGLTGANLLAPADLLRLNTSTPVTASPDRLAILAGDAQGFPNGRRLGDDVVDILLRLLAGGTPFTPSFNISPNNILTDGVDANDAAFLPAFPYASSPRSGYDQPATG